MIGYFLSSTVNVIVVLPYLVAVVAFLAYALPSAKGAVRKALWGAVLVFCASRGYFYNEFCGGAQTPALDWRIVLFWDWAFCGLVFLAALSLVWWPCFGRRWLLPVAAWGLAAFGMYCGMALPVVREVEIVSDRVRPEFDGYRIAYLVDLHCCETMRAWRTRGIVERVNALGADLVCNGGDYVDGRVDRLGGELEPITGLSAPDGVLWITGNHEGFCDWLNWRKWYAERGIRFLVNECVSPRPGLVVGGANDYSFFLRLDEKGPDLARTFASATNGEFRVLLYHSPRRLAEWFAQTPVDLALVGHTHGGVMPGFSSIIDRKYGGLLAGLHKVAKAQVYISSGAGQWCALPVRFFNPPEITLIVLKRPKL